MDKRTMLERCIEMVEDPNFTFGRCPESGCEYSPRDGVHQGCLIGRLFPAIGKKYSNGSMGAGRLIRFMAAEDPDVVPELASDHDLLALAALVQEEHDDLARQAEDDSRRGGPSPDRRAALLAELKYQLAKLTAHAPIPAAT